MPTTESITSALSSDALLPGCAITLAHDGVHWTSSFARAAVRLLESELEDGPLSGCARVDTSNGTQLPVLFHGEFSVIDDEHLTFTDGVQVPIENLLAIGY